MSEHWLPKKEIIMNYAKITTNILEAMMIAYYTGGKDAKVDDIKEDENGKLTVHFTCDEKTYFVYVEFGDRSKGEDRMKITMPPIPPAFKLDREENGYFDIPNSQR